MPVTVIVGGQFGSEGKGKVAHYVAREQHKTDERQYRQSVLPKMRIDRPIAVAMQI
jgi:hypothetical protein